MKPQCRQARGGSLRGERLAAVRVAA